ncbi:TRASH domain-containing protein [Halomicrobium urmianum]|uniref:TRASH domain-containing protein n=1 Tax=Halomicrobium urmianum TaxID=1586233 RepID=UPI001CD93B5E|nr:TRASH domain-containing protein [Halomicrobium urmianum]
MDEQKLRNYEIQKVENSIWNPQIDEADLATECVQCGKPIDGDGVSIEIEERRYYLCCSSCEALFREEYEKLRTAADGE